MKIFVKYFIWIIAIFIFIIVLSFIINSIKTREFKYKIIENQDPRIISLFKKSVQIDLSFKNACGNTYEQIFIYDYLNKYNLIIWNLNGFKNSQPIDIELVNNNEFSKISFNPESYTEWGNPRIKLLSKVEYLKTNKIIIHVEDDCDLIDHKKDTCFLFLNLKSKGFAIADSNIDYKLKVEFDNKLEYNLFLTNQNNSFQIIVLAAKNENIIENNMLLNIIQTPPVHAKLAKRIPGGEYKK